MWTRVIQNRVSVVCRPDPLGNSLFARPRGGTMFNLNVIENLKPTDLPTPPQDAFGVVRACTNPNVTSKTLGEIITHNAVLTAELMRIVNSAYFGFRAKISSAAHAVTLLGHRALSNLALCVAIRDAFRPDAIPLLDMADYLEQSLRRAV